MVIYFIGLDEPIGLQRKLLQIIREEYAEVIF